ncbi:MAG: sulfotransferase domain-containing protein [Phycisphaerales bacterium]|nr:sulfotransferase domain-containing protein [Phycisphaerales bacterium]
MSIKTLVPRALKVQLRRLPRYLRPAKAYVLPHYLIIGVQKGGTTSLDINLARHPFVRRSLLQEVHYFDYNHQRGPNWYRRHFHTRAEAERSRREQGHLAISGESSPYYIFHPHVPARVHELLPEVRLIALLRNPVDRAYSHYHHERRFDWDDATVEQAFDPVFEEQRVGPELKRMLDDPGYYSYAHQHYTYLSRGRYAEQLERWFSLFPRERLLILSSEAFYADMSGALKRVSEFLDLPPFDFPLAEKRNTNVYSRIDPETRARLAAYYRPHNEALFELLGERFDWDGA